MMYMELRFAFFRFSSTPLTNTAISLISQPPLPPPVWAAIYPASAKTLITAATVALICTVNAAIETLPSF